MTRKNSGQTPHRMRPPKQGVSTALPYGLALAGASLLIGYLVIRDPGAFEAEAAAAGARTTAAVPYSPIQRCINLGGGLEANFEGEWGYSIREEHLREIARAGFDTVRVPIRWSAHAENSPPYRIDRAFFARIDEVAAQGLASGLNVIINVHHYVELNENPEAHTARLAAIWSQIAARYADWPEGLIFELVNEPHSAMTPAKTDALNRDLMQIVRASNPDRWVIIGGAEWGSLYGLLKSNPPLDARSITTFHYYEPFKFTHQGAFFTDPPLPLGPVWPERGQMATLSKDMSDAARWQAKTGAPLLLGEFGVYTAAPLSQRAQWTADMRTAAEANGIGWCYWDFSGGFDAYDKEKEAWIAPILTALIPDPLR
jgi:endoglucanase